MNCAKDNKLAVFPITLGTMTYGNPVGFDQSVS